MTLRRLHLIELMDLPFWPRSWRRFMTDYLSFVSDRADLFSCAVPLLTEALEQTGDRKIVDLCSGSGGPWGSVAGPLFETTRLETIELTDLHPRTATGLKAAQLRGFSGHCAPQRRLEVAGLRLRQGRAPLHPLSRANLRHFQTGRRSSGETGAAFGDRIRPVDESIDALHVPATRKGFRTIWNGFHHFAPSDATRMLADAVESGEGIAVFEIVERRIAPIVALLLLAPWIVLAVTPLLRPVSLSRFFWTYVIPVVPAAVAFESFVSLV